jgi:ribosomal protein S20
MKIGNWYQRGVLRDPEPGAGGGDGGGAFDPAKFKTELLGEVGKLFAPITGKLKELEEKLKPTEPAAGGDGQQGDGKEPKPDATLQKKYEKLASDFDAEKKARAEADRRAEEKERHSLIRTELGKFQYAKENGVDQAFRILGSEIKRDDDGSLVGPEGQPFGEYISSQLTTNYDNLLAPKQAGGTGATGQRGGGQRTAQIEDIKHGMSQEERSRVRAAIAAALVESQQ